MKILLKTRQILDGIVISAFIVQRHNHRNIKSKRVASQSVIQSNISKEYWETILSYNKSKIKTKLNKNNIKNQIIT